MVAANQAAAAPANIKVCVVKPFYVSGVVKAKGALVELPRGLAMELIAGGKAERYVEPPAPPEKPEPAKK